MNWIEWAAITLCVLFAIPVLLLLFFLAALAWASIAGFWKNRQPAETIETSFGTFTKHGNQWSGTIEAGGNKLAIDVSDINGAPNPEWLRDLPALIQELPLWEKAAQQSVDQVTEGHVLYSVSDGFTETTDFILGFIYEDEPWSEIVYVEFYEGWVADWSTAD